MDERLQHYLDRIGFSGTPRADLATLEEIASRHVASFPFEALDAFTGTPPGIDTARHFAKLVHGGRGGWCYEHNGVLGAMLALAGFPVTRIAGEVMRTRSETSRPAGHLALLVECDGLWLVDIGFGGSLTRPLPLIEGEWTDGPYRVWLERLADGHWRFEERLGDGDPFSYDFMPVAADELALARMSGWQGSSPESNFVRNLVVQKREGPRHLALRGKVLTESRVGGSVKRELASAADLVTTLRDDFGIDLPEIAEFWPAIVRRHEALFPSAEPAMAQ